jgi:hypothetical protein
MSSSRGSPPKTKQSHQQHVCSSINSSIEDGTRLTQYTATCRCILDDYLDLEFLLCPSNRHAFATPPRSSKTFTVRNLPVSRTRVQLPPYLSSNLLDPTTSSQPPPHLTSDHTTCARTSQINSRCHPHLPLYLERSTRLLPCTLLPGSMPS